MPYADPEIKKQKELERRKRLRREDPVFLEKERAQRRAQMARSRERHGTAMDEPRKLKMKTDPIYASARRASKAAHNRASNKRCRARKNADYAVWRASRIQRTPPWADKEKIKAFYRLATAFSELYVPHHVDHIYPLNGELVSGLHVAENLQVIPATDNLIKGSRLLELAA